MDNCICNLEKGQEKILDYTAVWSHLLMKRAKDGFYIMDGDNNYYKINFCPCCGRKLPEE